MHECEEGDEEVTGYSASILEGGEDMHRETLSQEDWEETTFSTLHGAVVLRLIEGALHLGVTACPMPEAVPETMVRMTVRQAESLRDELTALLDYERVEND